jgi:hypothetical protein
MNPDSKVKWVCVVCGIDELKGCKHSGTSSYATMNSNVYRRTQKAMHKAISRGPKI